MRTLIWIVVVLSLLWGGYWFVGARGVETGLTAWLEARRAEGWLAEYSDITTRGFPNRFDTTISDFELADPGTGLAWTMPDFQILTLSYTPNHIIVAFPSTQTIASPIEKIAVDSDLMRGSVVFVPKTSLEIDRTSFELSNLSVSSSLGWATRVESGQFATRRSADRPLAHDVYFRASRVAPSRQLLGLLDPRSVLPETFEGVTLDATVTFNAPWDRFALERGRPDPAEIEIRTFDAGWGEITLQAAGMLTVDTLGRPEGRLDVRARNWRDMLRVARESGLVPAKVAPTVENALELLAGMSGNPETIDAPLTFRRGTMFFGGLPIGAAPVLTIR